MSREAFWWMAGALTCIAAMIVVNVMLHPHIFGTFFLVPEFFCLARYSIVMRRRA